MHDVGSKFLNILKKSRAEMTGALLTGPNPLILFQHLFTQDAESSDRVDS